ncbi:hypothetical protein LCGC14_1970930, partial [marine sediment metagenome]
MNDIAKGVIIGAVTVGLPLFFGYIFVVKENQLKIAGIEKELTRYNNQMGRTGGAISALKLFVVTAHPDKDYISLASARKLQTLKPSEIMVLASELSKIESQDATFSYAAISAE